MSFDYAADRNADYRVWHLAPGGSTYQPLLDVLMSNPSNQASDLIANNKLAWFISLFLDENRTNLENRQDIKGATQV